MKKIAFVVIGLLVLLLFSNAAVLAAGTPDSEQKVVIPQAWHGKNKIIIPHGDLVQVVYIKRTGDSTAPTNDPALVVGGPWKGTDLPKQGYFNGYDVADWHWVLSKTENQKGVKYIINPSEPVARYKLTQSDVVTSVQHSFQAWNTVGPKPTRGAVLYNYGGVSLTARHSDSIDNKNVISWGSVLDDYGRPDTIVAITYMWYKVSDGGLLDCDTVFNTFFTWSVKSVGSTSTYDIQDIGTHEFGHWTGLNDIYDDRCVPMTMYGYAWLGETYKQTLEQGDITGAHVAYGM